MSNLKLFFLFLNQNMYCGCSKELSQGYSSFEHPKNMLKLMGNLKKYSQFFGSNIFDLSLIFSLAGDQAVKKQVW